ncbi:U4/U6-U5 snRNP complex subunit SNU23 NDAI_0B03220 [Naumovozyma dairenensis CBS 421]|uniref:C2H2-type domain-containing protein n=1 Tax=Naumovozyma dairenensis (strain ATCC 10597 / BCRC 20456 / CBS 421 / NBRC 0211 / NRRL Y-12639) TaxID=1071378 RepID=G0W6E6_NAUDC|nr:hypothetical protein NDAI_0B03220 [Naumovozyma dairenensis CBS 421]CCD23357.1 hypothetical protein NDAI_0B03220 [Naumovozyma dairenensis CBS 421]
MSNFGRRTWNREEYAHPITTTYEASLEGSLSATELSALKQKYTNYDQLMRDSNKGINKKLLTTGLSEFKKGKQFGFYCTICDLTFKDTLQFINHLNHKTHEIKFENLFKEPLILDQRDNDDIPDAEFKLAFQNAVQDFVRASGIKKKREDNGDSDRKKNKSVKCNIAKSNASSSNNNEIAKMMGFQSFGSSKK